MFLWKIRGADRWWLRAATTVAAVAFAAAVGAPASAHTVLVSTSPQDGEELDEAPTQVELTFSGPVSATDSTMEVTGPDGASAAAGAPAFDGATVTVPLRVVDAGEYTVIYEVTAQDGHTTSGELAFTVTAQAVPAAAPTTPPADDPASEPTPPAAPTTAPPTDPRVVAGEDVDAGPSTWWWWLVAAGVLVLGGGLVWWRRRDRAPSGTVG